MDGENNEVGGGYRPPPEFAEVVKGPLLDINSIENSSSTELWLIQWPKNQDFDFDGKKLSLNLRNDGLLGSFQDLSGKSYDVVNFNAQDPNATVFLSSATEPKIVGKISRRISLVHYPEPSELLKQSVTDREQRSGTSLTNSSYHFSSATQSVRTRTSKSTSTHSSRHRNSLSEKGESSKHIKREHKKEQMRSDQSTQVSVHGHSAVTSSGSFGHSKKKRKLQE